jgi:hypothetical protein
VRGGGISQSTGQLDLEVPVPVSVMWSGSSATPSDPTSLRALGAGAGYSSPLRPRRRYGSGAPRGDNQQVGAGEAIASWS